MDLENIFLELGVLDPGHGHLLTCFADCNVTLSSACLWGLCRGFCGGQGLRPCPQELTHWRDPGKQAPAHTWTESWGWLVAGLSNSEQVKRLHVSTCLNSLLRAALMAEPAVCLCNPAPQQPQPAASGRLQKAQCIVPSQGCEI